MLCSHKKTVDEVGSRSKSARYATALTTCFLQKYPTMPPLPGARMIEYSWWEPYKFGVLETNRNKLRNRVNATEQAIRERASLMATSQTRNVLPLERASGTF